MSDIDQHKKELTRIANIEDYDDDSDALDDAGYLLTIACAFEKEIERLTKERDELKKLLADLHDDMRDRARMRGDVDSDGTVVFDIGATLYWKLAEALK